MPAKAGITLAQAFAVGDKKRCPKEMTFLGKADVMRPLMFLAASALISLNPIPTVLRLTL